MSSNSITPSNRSPLVHILTWFFFFVGLFFLIVRQSTRHTLKGAFKKEDWSIAAATVISFAQSIAASAAASNGLGKPFSSLGQSQIDGVLKAQYAATVLLVMCLGITKISTLFFTKGLSPDVLHVRSSYILGGATFLWMAIGIITTLFQCAPPQTWNYISGYRCVDLDAWWTFIATGNILTDVAVVALQSVLLLRLQVGISSKVLLLSIFSSRLIVVGAAIAQLVTYRSALGERDFTLSAWLPSVWNEVVQSLGITTACIPHIKRFLESLESGMIRVEEPAEEDTGTELHGIGNGSSARSGRSGRSGRSMKLNLGLVLSSSNIPENR